MKINAPICYRSRYLVEHKRRLPVLLSFLFLFSALAVQSQFTYTTNAGGTSITITGGPGGAVNIPSSIDGLTVTSIGDDAFQGFFLVPNVALTSVTIPGTVTNIGGDAFYYCTALTEVTLSNGLIKIEEGAFYEDNSLSSITIPGSVSSIGDNAFQDCTGLTNAVMMEGVTSIGNDAFLGCTNLRTVTIAGTVTNIGNDGFESCSNLTSTTIAGSVGTNAFEYRTSWANVTLSNGVGNIGDYAFYGCGGLTSIVIPGSVNSVGRSAFGGSSLSNLTISNGLSVIGDDAFAQSALLTSLTLPPSVQSIGEQAFENCKSLTNVTFSEGLTDIGLYAFSGCPINTLTLPASLVAAGYESFSGCSLTNLTIKGGVSGDYAFAGCGSLTNVTIGAGVTNLAYAMFYYCNSLTNVFFQGNAPVASGDPEDAGTNVFNSPVICYYLPGTTGWSNTYPTVPAVLWNPLIQTGNGNFGVQNNQFGFDITGTTNIPIVVQASTNLANPVWTALTNVTLTNGLFHFSEPAQANSAGRFYRISSP